MRALHNINYDGYVITVSNYDVDAEWRMHVYTVTPTRLLKLES